MYPAIKAIFDRARLSLPAVLQDRSGVTAIEYGLIVALISIFTIAWARFVGQTLINFFAAVNNGF